MYPGRPAYLGASSAVATGAAVACAAGTGGANLVCDAAALQGLPALVSSLFTGSSYDATHQVILQRVAAIAADPGLKQVATQQAWLALRCWAGDQTVITPADTAYLFGGGNVAQGCGCEVAHGCRADAQQAVTTLRQKIPSLVTGYLSTAPEPGLPGGGVSTTPSGTMYTTGPGGVVVGLPVPASSILSSSIGGVPIMVLALGAVMLAFAGGRRGRH